MLSKNQFPNSSSQWYVLNSIEAYKIHEMLVF